MNTRAAWTTSYALHCTKEKSRNSKKIFAEKERSAASRNRIRICPQMTQMHADKLLTTFPLPICVHRPGYLRAKVLPFPRFFYQLIYDSVPP